jgi:lysozyme
MKIFSWALATIRGKSPVPGSDMLGASTLPWTGGVSAEALELSKALEGLSLKPYLDGQNGTWTIGYGSTRDLVGLPVTSGTKAITEAQAVAMTERDLARAAKLLSEAFPQGLPPRWAGALILANNNLGDIRYWGGSLKSMVDSKQWGEAAFQMRKYRNQGGRPLVGLVRRRWTEAAYASGYSAEEAKRRAWAEIKTVDDWPRLPGDPRPTRIV